MHYLVHLGGDRFTASACAHIVEDLRTEGVEAALVGRPAPVLQARVYPRGLSKTALAVRRGCRRAGSGHTIGA